MPPSPPPLPEPCFPASDLHEYPHISTYTANYSPELVTLLSQQASWTVLQAAPELLDLLESAGVVPPPEAAAAAAGRGNATAAARGTDGAGKPSAGGNTTSRTDRPGDGATAAAAAVPYNASANASQPLNSSNLTAVESRAMATLAEIAGAPLPVQLAGAAPQVAQASQLGGGLPSGVRQPQNSYTMAIGESGVEGGTPLILQPAKNETVNGGGREAGRAGGRWWHVGLAALALAATSASRVAWSVLCGGA